MDEAGQFIYNEHNYSKFLVTSNDIKCHKTNINSEEKPQKLFKCEVKNCGQYFISKHNLTVHQKRIHWKIKPFKCNENNCNKCFVTSVELRIHEILDHAIIHMNEKLFKCDINNCGQSFVRKSHLLVHKKIIHKIKPYKCDDNNCNKCFTHFI